MFPVPRDICFRVARFFLFFRARANRRSWSVVPFNHAVGGGKHVKHFCLLWFSGKSPLN